MFNRQHWLAKALIALVTGAVLICAVIILPPLWEAAQSFAATAPNQDPHQCLKIPHGPERLACFENLMHQPPPQPARGANAPERLFHGSDKANER